MDNFHHQHLHHQQHHHQQHVHNKVNVKLIMTARQTTNIADMAYDKNVEHVKIMIVEIGPVTTILIHLHHALLKLLVNVIMDVGVVENNRHHHHHQLQQDVMDGLLAGQIQHVKQTLIVIDLLPVKDIWDQAIVGHAES